MNMLGHDKGIIVTEHDVVHEIETLPSFHCLKLDTVQDTVQQPATTAIQQSSTTELASSENRELKTLDRIYGRDEEQKIILQTYQQTIHQDPANPSVLIIQGEEGIGKTFLVEQTLSKHVRVHDHGLFVHWKLQNVSLSPNLETVSPDDGFVDAFTSLTNQILAADASILHEIQDTFSQEMNENDRLVLAEMIPCILPLLGPFDPDAIKSSNVQASGRQVQIFIQMFRIIAKPERPIVLFMDNIHHADACNLRLLEFLLQDTEIQGIFLVLSLGPAQSDDVHQFVSTLENQTNMTRTAVSIHLQPLDATTTHRMVADILHIDLETSATLHNSLQSRIRGNPRCLYSLLRWMHLNQYLQWEKSTETWHWNAHHLLDCQDHESTLRTSWSQLPVPLQTLLQAASCIGNQISTQYLHWIVGESVSLLLQDATTHGWTIPDHKSDHQSCKVYSFLSDSVREAAYSTIPSEQRDSFHLMIGRKLWKGFDEQDTSNLQAKHQSLILSQMLQGARAIVNPQELAATAALCLSVAKEDVKWSTFSTAAISLDKGINLLGNRSWREEYDLTLALHNTSAEVNYVLGDFEIVHRRCEAIFQNARMVDHTLLASSVKISILSAESNIDEALKIGHEVLNKIGEPVISKPRKSHLTLSIFQLRRLLKRTSPDAIRRLPLMTDSRKAAAMQIMNHMIMPAHLGRENLMPILASRLVQLTIKSGLCNVSSVAIGWCGLLHIAMGQMELASEYGKLALELLNRFDSKQWLPRVYMCVFGGVFGWTQNIKTVIAPLSRAFKVGIETGDNEYAFLNVILKCSFEFSVGRELHLLAQECDNLLEDLMKLKHKWALFSLKAMMHTIRCLMGCVDYAETIALLVESENDIDFPNTTSIVQFLTGYHRLILSYIMRDMNQALTEACALQILDHRPYHEVDSCMIFTLDCLARMDKCPLNGIQRRSTFVIVRKRISILKRFASVNPHLCLGMLHLVQAKVAQNKGKVSEATNLYISSMAILGSENLLSVHPLACEQMARFMLTCSKKEEARIYFQESLESYKKWGANQKCDLLKIEINELSIS